MRVCQRPIAAITVLCVFLSTSLSASGQESCAEIRSLPDSQQLQRQYRSSCLSLELVGFGELSPAFLGMTETSTWRKWNAYRGFDQIPESSFLRICGYSHEANLAAKHHRNASMQEGAGYFFSTVGLIGIILSASNLPEDEEDDARQFRTIGWVSIVTAVLGLGLIFSGERKSKQNLTPYGLASQLADDYNEQLCREIATRAGIEMETEPDGARW